MKLVGTTLISAILCAAVACTGSKQQAAEDNTQTATPEQGQKVTGTEAAQPEETEEDKEREERKRRIAENIEKAKQAAEKEAERWTDDLRKQVTDLVAADYQDAKAALEAILASPHRTPENPTRDEHRHPLETLTFFGLEPGMTVLEAGAGAGWYTEILAPLLAKSGKLIVVGYDPNGPDDSFFTYYGQRLRMSLDKSPELFGKVEVTHVNPPDQLTLAPAGTVDLALAFREMHGWYRRGHVEKYLAALHEALEPGGILGIVQHRAKPGADPAESAEKGYLPEAWVIEAVEAAGFELVEKSEINANPNDTKDYENGVWTLPPGYRLGDQDRAKYEAIGESDRMTLKFMKPRE